MNRRGQDRTGPLGGSGMVGLWGASSLIKSIQQTTITIASGSASNTATITSVDVANSIALSQGFEPATPYYHNSALSTVDLTNATTVTVARLGTSDATIVGVVVVEFMPGVVKSAQNVAIGLSSGTSTTSSITAVNTNKAFLYCTFRIAQGDGGLGATYGPKFAYVRTALTNSTTVTVTRNADSATDYGVSRSFIVEFF